MCSEKIYAIMLLLVIVFSCSPYQKMQKIRSGEVEMILSVPEEEPLDDEDEPEVKIDSIRSSLTDEPLIMNAIRDAETGEMVATDVIGASKVTARFRNVAERAGYVSIGFDVTVPAAMADSDWQLKIHPQMRIMEDTVALEPLFITGEGYRYSQLRGYERYQAFLSSIIKDSLDFIRIGQLEIFLQRHFPETYAMKCDSSIISEPMAENFFGVTQRDALVHYTRHLKWKRNEWRKGRIGKMYDRYVKDPILTEGVRLDTVIKGLDGDFVYRYTHTFRSVPKLKKVMVSLDGSLYERGECIHHFPFPEDLTFYISSLSSLVDDTPRYRIMVVERSVRDNTKAFIDFSQGSSHIDTTLGDNATELRRVMRCIEDVVSRKELVLDSLVIVASCSPEGSYSSNRKLSAARSEAVRRYIGDYVPAEWRDILKASELPENWEQMALLVANDTVLKKSERRLICDMIQNMEDPDKVERSLSRMSEYRYLREKIYPMLRSVRFDFHLHRMGMLKDTVHTTELDTMYMNGIMAMKDLDYKKAVTCLRSYDDYNAALACMSADYNHSALDILSRQDDREARVCYLKALVLSRLEQYDEAVKYFELCLAYDPHMEFRANLDPEMAVLVKRRRETHF